MNIVFFHANGIVPTAGGISRTTSNLCRLFRSQGHNVWLCGCQDKHPQADYDKEQVFLPDSTAITSLRNVDFLCSFCLSNNIQVIINQSPFSEDIVSLLALCREKGVVKVVSCYHNSILTPIIRYAYQKEFSLKLHAKNWQFSLLKSSLVSRLLVSGYIWKHRRVFQKTIQQSDAVVVLCEGQKDELLRMCGYELCEKISIIPNCIPQVEVRTDVTKQKMVLWVGTFDYAIKRPDLMLDVWELLCKNHSDWSLYMLGDGPSLEDTKRLSKLMGLKNIDFKGRVNPKEYYEVASIQCMTSVHEAFPMVPLEAMSNSIPVIAFNSFTSAPLIIEEGLNGILIPPFDTKHYADSLRLLIEDEAMRSSMSWKARQSVNRFSEEKIFDLWQQLFEHI